MTHPRTLTLLTLLIALGLTACAVPFSREAASSGENDIVARVDSIGQTLNQLEAAARTGDYTGAETLRRDAYEQYEAGLEKFLDNRDPELAHKIEGLLGAEGLQGLIAAQAEPEKISAAAGKLRHELEEAETYSASTVTGTLAVFNSAVIILREGLEAVLIIAVIVGYLKTTKRDPKYLRLVYAGVGAALLLSLATWWASTSLITITAANREVLEGTTSLLAVAVLFYCTNWLFHKAYVLDWMTFVKQEAGKALATGSALGLAALGFTVVYREGFETVLFYQAMLFKADPAPVVIGFAAGSALLALIALGVLRMSVKLPMRPFFSVTGALMLILAFKFVGLGVHEFQEAGFIGETLLPGVPVNAVLRDVLGIYPTIETLAGQVILMVGVGVTLVISRWQWKRTAPAAAETM